MYRALFTDSAPLSRANSLFTIGSDSDFLSSNLSSRGSLYDIESLESIDLASEISSASGVELAAEAEVVAPEFTPLIVAGLLGYELYQWLKPKRKDLPVASPGKTPSPRPAPGMPVVERHPLNLEYPGAVPWVDAPSQAPLFPPRLRQSVRRR